MELLVLWLVGWGFVSGAIDEDVPWWTGLGLFFIWPVILGGLWRQSMRRKEKDDG